MYVHFHQNRQSPRDKTSGAPLISACNRVMTLDDDVTQTWSVVTCTECLKRRQGEPSVGVTDES